MTLQQRIAALITSIGSDVKALFGRVLPPGGTAGQVLSKSSGSDYAVAWSTPASGGGGGGITKTTSTGTTPTIAFAGDFNHNTHVTSGNTTFAFSGAADGYQMTLVVKIGTAGHTLTFTGVTWPGNVTPSWSTAVNSVVAISFFCQGTTVRSTGYTSYTS